MKKVLVALLAAMSFLLVAVAPGAGAQDVGDQVYNDGTIYIGNGQCQGPKGHVFTCDFGGSVDGSATDGTADAGAATATDGASTDGYVPGGTTGGDGGQAPNCGPGPNGYTWYQDPCPTEYSGGEPGPNCGPGPNGYMWYQDPCPAEYSGTAGQPGATDGGGDDKGGAEGQNGTKKGAVNIEVVDEKGDVLATASGEQAVITVDPAGADRELQLVDADTGEVIATSTVAAGGTIAAAKAPAAAVASAAALPNTGASSLGMAQLALILVAAGGVLVLFGKRNGAAA